MARLYIEYDMARLLSSEAKPLILHTFVYKSITDRGLLAPNPRLLQAIHEAAVGHNRGHHSITVQHASCLQALGENIEDRIAVHHPAVTAHGNASVAISVKGKAEIEMLFLHKRTKPLNMRGAAFAVDIQPIRRVTDHRHLRTERAEHASCDHPRSAVGTVKSDL